MFDSLGSALNRVATINRLAHELNGQADPSGRTDARVTGSSAGQVGGSWAARRAGGGAPGQPAFAETMGELRRSSEGTAGAANRHATHVPAGRLAHMPAHPLAHAAGKASSTHGRSNYLRPLAITTPSAAAATSSAATASAAAMSSTATATSSVLTAAPTVVPSAAPSAMATLSPAAIVSAPAPGLALMSAPASAPTTVLVPALVRTTPTIATALATPTIPSAPADPTTAPTPDPRWTDILARAATALAAGPQGPASASNPNPLYAGTYAADVEARRRADGSLNPIDLPSTEYLSSADLLTARLAESVPNAVLATGQNEGVARPGQPQQPNDSYDLLAWVTQLKGMQAGTVPPFVQDNGYTWNAGDISRNLGMAVTQVVANKTMYNARWESRWALLRANGYSDVADKEQATVKLVDPNGPPGSI